MAPGRHGRAPRDALRRYAADNPSVRRIEEKAEPKLVETLRRCILLKLTKPRLTDLAQVARGLPFPVLFHTTEHLHGGFDRQYLDHLPPRPDVGTPEDLNALIRTCREHGHLFMPYTNPTWWCVNPRGSTFERVGEAPLSVGLDGRHMPESYGDPVGVQGYTVCAWHPAMRAANDVIREQFTREHPVDILFQDQVGARGHRWDFNPAAPHPGAYLEGVHRIAKTDSRYVPLATEDGHDRLIDCELAFCGLSFPWLPNRRGVRDRELYWESWLSDAWRFEPLALWLAHDRVFFFHHNLGGSVRDRLDLSISLVMGYGLSWWMRAGGPPHAERDWIDRLCRVQQAVGPRCAGRPLDFFDHRSPLEVRSRWGDLDIVANLGPRPLDLDDGTRIAPEGFLARSPDLEASIFCRTSDGLEDPRGFWRIRERRDGQWTVWSAGPETPP